MYTYCIYKNIITNIQGDESVTTLVKPQNPLVITNSAEFAHSFEEVFMLWKDKSRYKSEDGVHLDIKYVRIILWVY